MCRQKPPVIQVRGAHSKPSWNDWKQFKISLFPLKQTFQRLNPKKKKLILNTK